MTNTYLIHAWCVRPFITCIDVEAETPEQAIAVARGRQGKLLDAAEECSGAYPWDEFAAYDESGNEKRHEIDDDARLHRAAAELKEALAWLATAAEDIDVAIQGVTDEFDTERMDLDAACCHARDVLAKTTIRQRDAGPV
jgi:hypothetical protein